MRPLVVTAFAVFTAAALAAAPASAQHQRHGGGGGHHGGGFGGHRHGGGGGWVGPGLVLGLGAAAIAAGIAASQRDCVRYEEAYDDWGNYIGRRRVDEC